MHADIRQWKQWDVKLLDLLQLLARSLVGLQIPPAWNLLALAQVFDDLFDSLLGNAQFFGDLRANAIILAGNGQFEVARLNLSDLFGRGYEWSWWWLLLLFGSWQRRRLGLCHFLPLRLKRFFASSCPSWSSRPARPARPARSGAKARSGGARITALCRRARALPK